MANLVNNVLVPDGLPVVYDDTSAFVGTAPGPVIGYDSHGVHQASTPPNYITSGLNITLANGAVFNSWESYNAISFTPGVYTGNQGQVAQWIAKGVRRGRRQCRRARSQPKQRRRRRSSVPDALERLYVGGSGLEFAYPGELRQHRDR